MSAPGIDQYGDGFAFNAARKANCWGSDEPDKVFKLMFGEKSGYKSDNVLLEGRDKGMSESIESSSVSRMLKVGLHLWPKVYLSLQ